MNYSDGKALHDKLDLIIASCARIEASATGTIAELRAEINALVAAAQINDAEKAALTTKVNAAFMKSEDVEDKMRSAIPKQ